MRSPDGTRLGLFVGVLALAAAALLLVARAAGVSPVALAPVYMFSPLVAGLAVCLRWDVPLSTVGLRLGRPRWLLAGAVTAIPLVVLALALSVAIPGIGLDLTVDPVAGVPIPSGALGVVATLGVALALGATLNAVVAFGEEFGWRGYLLWELAPLGFWRASLAIGALWGVWHAPIIVAGYNYPSFPVVGVGAIIVACVAFSPVYTYLTVRAESVLAATLLHGVFNGSAGLVVAYAVTDDAVLSELVASPVGAAGVLAFGLAALAIAYSGAPALTREFARGDAPASSGRDAAAADG
ncbi:CPBP family intramembrane glutamic endopeptidase [Halorussus halobius]|uniref:CPBP family intramembrane glutamic endopeptidase n=1 Tax=Halorussus halobius TaxID=1710537 RepID=UPI0010919F21|nr:CPBP family intramembrane glutamic endopeptidase [Halorussus halobius]